MARLKLVFNTRPLVAVPAAAVSAGLQRELVADLSPARSDAISPRRVALDQSRPLHPRSAASDWRCLGRPLFDPRSAADGLVHHRAWAVAPGPRCDHERAVGFPLR